MTPAARTSSLSETPAVERLAAQIDAAVVRPVYAQVRRLADYTGVQDAAQEALLVALKNIEAGDAPAGFDDQRLRAWVAGTTRQMVLYTHRRENFRGRDKDQPVLRVDLPDESGSDDEGIRISRRKDEADREAFTAEAEIDTRADRQAANHQAAQLSAELNALPADERRLLLLRYADQLDTQSAARVMGIKHDRARRLHTAAIKHLSAALGARIEGPACETARMTIDIGVAGQSAGREQTTARDAHMESCLACQTYYAKARGALALMPAPALGWVDRGYANVASWASRIGSVLPSIGGTSPEAIAAGGTGATAAGTSFGAIATAVGTKTVVACATVAVASGGICAGVVVRDHKRDRDRPAKERASTSGSSSPRVRGSAASTLTSASAVQSIRKSTPASATSSTSSNTGSGGRASSGADTSRDGDGSLGVEGMRDPDPDAVRAATASAKRTTAQPRANVAKSPATSAPAGSSASTQSSSTASGASAPDASAPAKAPSTPSGSSFAGEFAP